MTNISVFGTRLPRALQHKRRIYSNTNDFLRYICASQMLTTGKDPVPKSRSDWDSVVLLEEMGVSVVPPC